MAESVGLVFAARVATSDLAGLSQLPVAGFGAVCGVAPSDLEAAGLACDIAGLAFERISPRLRPDERTGLAGLLTQIRMSIVKKRG